MSWWGWDRLVEAMVFFPQAEHWARPERFGLTCQEEWIPTADGQRLHAWWLPAPGSDTVLLFCHGNAGNISHRLPNLKLLHDLGLSVLIFDYRGYGLSSGRIDEQGFFRDAAAAYQAAAAHARQQRARLVVFGRSLGGVAAVRVAAEQPVAGVILESTFTNLADMARHHFPLLSRLGPLAGRLEALAWVDRIRAPILFLHGDRDQVVPLELGRRLYQAATAPKQWVTITGAGHNDTIEVGGEQYLSHLRRFIASLPPPPGMEGP